MQCEPTVAQYSLTTLSGKHSTGQETIRLNHQAHVPLPLFVGIPLSASLERDDLAMQTQLIQFNKRLLNPCDVSGTPLGC